MTGYIVREKIHFETIDKKEERTAIVIAVSAAGDEQQFTADASYMGDEGAMNEARRKANEWIASLNSTGG